MVNKALIGAIKQWLYSKDIPLNGLYGMKITNNERNIGGFLLLLKLLKRTCLIILHHFWSQQKMAAMTNLFVTSKIPGIFISTKKKKACQLDNLLQLHVNALFLLKIFAYIRKKCMKAQKLLSKLAKNITPICQQSIKISSRMIIFSEIN